MPLGDYLVGALFAAGTWGGAVVAAETLRRRQLQDLRGVWAWVAGGLLIALAVAVVHLVPLALGVLTRGTALAAALLLAAGTRAVPRRPAAAPAPPPLPSSTLSWALAGLAALGAATFALGELFDAATRPLGPVDLLSYDLPVIADWIHTGSAWQITELFPLQTHGTYPQNGHLVLLAAILPFHNDALVRLAVYPFAGLAGLSVYALGTELRATAATAALLAAAFASIPVVATAVEFAPVDTIGMAAFAGGAAFLARHARTGAVWDLALAGAGLGFALGTKWYYATAVAAVIAVRAVAGLVARRGLGRTAREAAALGGLALACGGFWLVRNWVETGDPVYPQAVPVLGFDAPHDVYRQLVGFRLSDYLFDGHIWDTYALPAFRGTFATPGVLAVLGAAAVLVTAAARRARWGRTAVTFAALVPVLGALYLVTPYTAFGPRGAPTLISANARYFIPGLVVAAAVSAVAIGRAGRLRVPLELLALAATAQGLRLAIRDLHPGAGALALAAAVLVAGAGAVWLARTRDLRPRRAAAWPAILAVGGLVVAGYAVQRDLNRDRYRAADPTFAWVADHAPAGRRIGLAGYWRFDGVSPAWPLVGPRIGNRVAFVGRLDGDRLTQHRTRERFARAVRDGRYDLLLVARAPTPGFAGPADEPRWAQSEGWPAVAASSRFVLYAVRPDVAR